ncbi:hypothetical protein J3E72DRAFT_322399 [Bipolaris maydis]|uniref:uncharacterized protein n=1 Tax=Cochliobolus heterostrophus TaxID=5016 RepID=UPI0024D29471|nr:hypothetical protein J3E73DRAFT_307282 [Bipolaris maydis]KAJ5059683.1 hypothetical protein J3E74DRAFT_349779 [Bipolaris maydis]KAJ6197350.1 hypothetical protein J3E72DRAFT_322399 [Bipolaris maydis]KAJ6209677.1 hypothetical protein PSV09DRAFT_2309551 [Bipolaris maydis]KAJ6271343.1 hypothetical protein PSV08DRAFT_293126 [Bipolaris maydis]
MDTPTHLSFVSFLSCISPFTSIAIHFFPLWTRGSRRDTSCITVWLRYPLFLHGHRHFFSQRSGLASLLYYGTATSILGTLLPASLEHGGCFFMSRPGSRLHPYWVSVLFFFFFPIFYFPCVCHILCSATFEIGLDFV